MTAMVQTLARLAATTEGNGEGLKVVIIFCCAGLFVSLLFLTHGVDLGPGFFD